jgi:hypothetical protein
MSADQVLAAVALLNRRTLERARALALAVELLAQGKTRRDACAALRARHGLSKTRAWRVVDMAADMAGPTGAEKC